MLGYFIFILLFFLFCQIKNNHQLRFSLVFILVIVFTGLRYGIGSDYFMYYTIAKYYGDVGIRVVEFLPGLILHYSSLTSPYVFFWISSIIINGIFVYVIYYETKYTKMFPIAMFFWICFPYFYLQSLSIIRQFMAFAFVALSYTKFKNKTIYRIFMIVIATLCHQSAVVAIITLYPIERISKQKLVLLFISSLFLGEIFMTVIKSIHLNNIIFYKLQSYIIAADTFKGGGIIKYLIYIITIVVLWKYNFLAKNEKTKYYIGLIVIGAAFHSLFAVSPHTAQRLCTFFFVASIFLIPNCIKLFNIQKVYCYLCFLLLFVGYIFIQHTKTYGDRPEDKNGYSSYYPYRTIFNE